MFAAYMRRSTDETLTRRGTTHSWRWLEETKYSAKSKRSTAPHYLHVKNHSTSTSNEITLWQWGGTTQIKLCPMSTVPWILGGKMLMEPINQSGSKDQLFQVDLKTKLKRDRMKWSRMLQVLQVNMKMGCKRKLRKTLNVSGAGTVVMKVKQIRFVIVVRTHVKTAWVVFITFDTYCRWSVSSLILKIA